MSNAPTNLSRRAALAISAAAVAGTAGSRISAASAAAPVGTSRDTILIDAWTKYGAAMAHDTALDEKIGSMYQAALASLPPHLEHEEFLRLTNEERDAYKHQRGRHYEEAFDKHGVTAAQEEQDHFLESVADPLAVLIRNTVPSTLQGAAIKAAYLLKFEQHEIFQADRLQDLDWEEQGLRLFIEQLAALSPGEA